MHIWHAFWFGLHEQNARSIWFRPEANGSIIGLSNTYDIIDTTPGWRLDSVVSNRCLDKWSALTFNSPAKCEIWYKNPWIPAAETFAMSSYTMLEISCLLIVCVHQCWLLSDLTIITFPTKSLWKCFTDPAQTEPGNLPPSPPSLSWMHRLLLLLLETSSPMAVEHCPPSAITSRTLSRMPTGGFLLASCVICLNEWASDLKLLKKPWCVVASLLPSSPEWNIASSWTCQKRSKQFLRSN